MIERSPIKFSRWRPVRRDHGIAYSYVNPADGRRVSPGSDRWSRVKGHIAAAAIATGAETFICHGGGGRWRWVREVTITEAEAEAYFSESMKGPTGFMLRGKVDQAHRIRDRRLAKAE